VKTSALMLLGLVSGIVLFNLNVIGLHFAFFPGDLGDGRLNLYFLEHAHQFFSGHLKSYWDAPFMYPEKNVMAYSDNLLGSAPVFSLFRFLGMNTYKSYQLWFVVVSAFNYISAFYFLKYVFRNDYSAVLGAFVFAFSIALQSQLTHAQTFPRFAIPLAFLMAVKFSEELKPAYFFSTLLFVVYQIYCGIYLGFMLAVPIGIYLLLTIVKKKIAERQVFFTFSWFSRIALSALMNILILLPLMSHYLERKTSPGISGFKGILGSVPTLKSYLFSQHGSLFWNFLSRTGSNIESWWDHQIFTGGIATLCLLVGICFLIVTLYKTKFRLSNLSVPLLLQLTGLVTCMLFVRIKGVSLYFFIYFMPGFCSMRSMTRIINVELIFFAISTAFIFTAILNKYSRFGMLIFIAAFVLMILDNYFHSAESYRTNVSVARERLSCIEKVVSKIPAGSVFSYEPPNLEPTPIFFHMDAMLVSQQYQLKTLNAYTGSSPAEYKRYWDKPDEDGRNYWLEHVNIGQDTLYVIRSADDVEKVLLK
jgi:hypothetical protein